MYADRVTPFYAEAATKGLEALFTPVSSERCGFVDHVQLNGSGDPNIPGVRSNINVEPRRLVL
jgi:hypothetical protein